MKRIRSTALFEYAAVLAFVLAAGARPAHAYLDPGTGSYAFQVGVAGVFGALFSLKMFWSRLRTGRPGGRSHSVDPGADAKETAQSDSRRDV